MVFLKRDRMWIGIVAAVTGLMGWMLAGCGGSSTGSSSGHATSALQYSGPTTPAAIDASNAKALVNEVYSQTSQPDPLSVNRTTRADGVKAVTMPITLRIAKALATAVRKAGPVQLSLESSDGATLSGPILGSCGGSADYKMRADAQNDDFSGSFVFDRLCENGTILNGAASFSGKLDFDQLEIVSLSYTFQGLSSTTDGHTLHLDGTISFDWADPVQTLLMNLLLQDSNDMKVFRVKDFNIETESGRDESIQMSGTFYHPDYGAIEVATASPLLISVGDTEPYTGYPYTGTLTITGGASAGGGVTKAVLEVLSSQTYQVSADCDGDGELDWGPVDFDWEAE